MFKVFNPFTGLHDSCVTVEEASSVKATFVRKWVAENSDRPVVFGTHLFISDWLPDFYAAYLFVCNKNQQTPKLMPEALQDFHVSVSQNHALYNVDTASVWARVFRYGNFDNTEQMFKVRNGVVTDWYKRDFLFDGVTYPWVCLNPDTGDVQEVYRWAQENVLLEKQSVQDPLAPTVTTVFSSTIEDFPEEVRQAASNAGILGAVFAWSERSYGKIIEYVENITAPQETWPQEAIDRQQQLDADARDAAESYALGLVTITQVTINDAGDEVWTAV